jgi:hypothetical protein
MPTKREPLHHPARVRITPEVLALFLELENMSQRSQKFKDGSHQLARMLDLVEEWWTSNHVNDASAEPCHPEGMGYIANVHWRRCRRVRRELLAASASATTNRLLA